MGSELQAHRAGRSGSGGRRLWLWLAVVGALALNGPASLVPAASATVHVDPKGPAGQQYALPLDSARGEASGTPAAGVPGATVKAPLFGQGITPRERGAAKGTSSSGGHHGAAGQAAKKQTRATAADNTNAEGRSVVAIVRAGASGSTTLWILGLIGGVLLLGGAAGLIMRWRASTPVRA